MKNILFIVLLFLSFSFVAQDVPEMPKYNAKNASNIFYYNSGEVPKEIKVKKEELKNLVAKSIRIYNDKVKEISFLNFQKLQELDLIVNSAGDQIYTNRDLADNIRQKIETTVVPIRDSITKFEKKLNENLEVSLSKKQYKKWLRYQRNKKNDLIPKRPSNNSAQPPRNMNRNRMNNNGMGNQRRF